ncbi:MAG: radical SAM protein [Candidatus Aenigmatarchaeota archaeon]
MKVCFVNVPYKEEVYGKVKDVSLMEPPLGICYLAATLEKEGYEVKIIDAEAERLATDALVKKVEELKPGVIGLTCTTPMVASVKRTSEALKKALPDSKIVVGGPHVTAVPEDLLKESYIDIAAIGEAEHTIVDLVKHIEENKSLKGCKGIAFKEDGKIVKTECRPLIEDVDKIPFPARHLLSIDKYMHATIVSRKTKKNYTNIMSSRGCPFKCIFCGSRTTFGGVARFRTPKLVVDEIEECYNKYDIGMFGFSDDTLTVKKEHISEICNEIIKRKLEIVWFAQARVSTVDKEILELMKKAGCEAVHYGYESGNQEILNNIKKGITLQQAIDATRITKEVGIKIHGYFMIGNPGETEETIKQTIAFAKKLDPDTAQFTMATPFPGTELYEIFLSKSHEIKEFKDYRWYNDAVFVPSGMTKEQLLKLHGKAYREFYMRPKYILRSILRLRSLTSIKQTLAGFRTLLKVGW